MKRTGGSLTREGIAAAAIRCFERYGPHRTSMADIADEANISRQSVYRFFEDRSTLIQYILNERISVMAESLRAPFSKFKTIEEALVEGSLISLRTSRKDKLFTEIVTASTDHSIEVFLMRTTEDIRTAMAQLWTPILDKARADGLIRAGITNEKILAWIRSVHTVLTIRDDLDEKAQRQMLQDFFVPSVVQPARTRTRRNG
jgi:AcrR family transcriptional regulator